MELGIVFLTLLHVLVAIYWLGGDLGAFYGSTFMTDPKRSVPERMMALKILNNIDMAPRTCLILAFPTGFALAAAKGWINVPTPMVVAVAVAFLAWLGLAWAVHLAHGSDGFIKKLDLAIRYVVLIALGGTGIKALITPDAAIPLFMALKMIVLATAVSLGLVVRKQLVPLFGAIRTMTTTGPTPETDATIREVNGRARVSVLTIWALILVASFLGLATPV